MSLIVVCSDISWSRSHSDITHCLSPSRSPLLSNTLSSLKIKGTYVDYAVVDCCIASWNRGFCRPLGCTAFEHQHHNHSCTQTLRLVDRLWIDKKMTPEEVCRAEGIEASTVVVWRVADGHGRRRTESDARRRQIEIRRPSSKQQHATPTTCTKHYRTLPLSRSI